MRSYGNTNAAPYASAPAVGAAGDTYFNTTTKQLNVSDGTAWLPVIGGSGGVSSDNVLSYVESTNISPTFPIGTANLTDWLYTDVVILTQTTWVRITVYGDTLYQPSVINTELYLQLFSTSGGACLAEGRAGGPTTVMQASTPWVTYVAQLPAGSYQWKVMGCTARGTASVYATVGKPAYIMVEALRAGGPQGPPGPSGVSGNVPVYANAAARDAAMPSPSNGQSCVLLSPSGMQVYRSTDPIGWWPPWNTPWGRIYYNMLTSGNIVLPGNNETPTADLGLQSYLSKRNYVITGELTLSSTLTTARALARIYNVTDGLRKTIQDGPLPQANLKQTRQASIHYSPAIGTESKQFQVTFQNAGAAGNLTCDGSTIDGAWIAAYDVGPQPNS